MAIFGFASIIAAPATPRRASRPFAHLRFELSARN